MLLFQDAEPSLTLTRVATAPALIAEIAKATGQKLDVSPTLATEIIMVSVEKARVNDVLGKIAIAATAQWQPMDGGYRLVADNATRSIQASSERARRLQAMTEEIKKRSAAKTKADGDDETPDMGGMFGMGGSVDAFVPMLDLNALANMEPGQRLVFATNANGAQRPLRGNPMPLVATMIAGHNKTAQSMAGHMDEMPEQLSGLMQGPFGDRMKRMSRPVTGTPTKVLVVASRASNMMFGGLDSGVRLEVRAYGADGAVLIEQTGSLGSSVMTAMASIMEKTKAPAAPAAKPTPIEYSEDAKALFQNATPENPFMGGGFGKGTKFSPSLHQRLFNPDKFEPLSLSPGESLAALAKARRKPLVASIPDSAYPSFFSAPPKTVEDVEESLKTGEMRVVPDATYLVVRAAEPEAARRNRVDREALATLLHAIDDHESPTLDELATFATKSPPPSQNSLEMGFIILFAPSTMGSMSGMVSWDALRLFAALSPAQRDSLARGADVPFSTLAPAAKTSLAAMLYGANDGLTAERPGVANEPDIFGSVMKMMMGGGGIDVRDEPTEAAPQGLPASGFLRAAVTNDSILRPVGADGPIYYALGMDELAMMKMFASSELPGAAAEAMKLPDEARLGSRTVWNLRGYVASGVYVGTTLSDDRTPKDGAKVSLNALPSDLQAKVAQKTEKLKKSPLGAIMAMGGAFGKPPVQP